MSRIIEILSAIRNGETHDALAMSRAESILQSIANGTAYTDEPLSRFEELLLAIKNGETVGETSQTRVEEILSAIANGTLDDYLSGKNLVNIRNYYESKNEEIRIVDEIVYAREVVNALFFKVVIEKNKYYTVTYSLESTVQEPSTGKWRLFYTDGSYSDIGLNGTSVLVDKEVKYLLIYANSGTTSDVVLSNLKLEIGSSATPYTPYSFDELEEALVATADKLKGA